MASLLTNIEQLAKDTITAIQTVSTADLIAHAWKARKEILEKCLGRVRATYDPNDDGVVDDTTGIRGKSVAASAATPSDGDVLVFNSASNRYEPFQIPTAATILRLGAASTLSDGEWLGMTHDIAFSETATPGDVVYVDSSGKAAKAKADSSTTIPVAHMVLQTVSAGDVAGGTLKLVLEYGGYFRNDSWAALTVGGSAGMLYLSAATAGAVVQAVPGTGNKIQALGFAVAPKIVAFRPDVTWATAS